MAATGLKRGELVRWDTHGNGRQVHHVGVVVLRVPAFTPASVILENMAQKYSLRALRRTDRVRSTVSYLVACTEGGKRGKARLHWPHACLLRRYGGQADAAAT